MTVERLAEPQPAESMIGTISVRAWLAIFTVTTGLGFVYVVSLLLVVAAIFKWVELDPALNVLLLALNAVTGFVGLALGYYLGQKSATPPPAELVVEHDIDVDGS